MGEEKKVEVTLTNSIEVMSTQVTQKQWVEIMGENPSRFSDGKDSIVVNIKGKSVRMNPDHPLKRSPGGRPLNLLTGFQKNMD